MPECRRDLRVHVSWHQLPLSWSGKVVGPSSEGVKHNMKCMHNITDRHTRPIAQVTYYNWDGQRSEFLLRSVARFPFRFLRSLHLAVLATANRRFLPGQEALAISSSSSQGKASVLTPSKKDTNQETGRWHVQPPPEIPTTDPRLAKRKMG
jgi:hypothetical protein